MQDMIQVNAVMAASGLGPFVKGLVVFPLLLE